MNAKFREKILEILQYIVIILYLKYTNIIKVYTSGSISLLFDISYKMQTFLPHNFWSNFKSAILIRLFL